nr:MAG TPA: hypothetical protein [Caudoviricetes sp.]
MYINFNQFINYDMTISIFDIILMVCNMRYMIYYI